MQHICYAEDDFAELQNDKCLQLEFSKQFMSFLDKNRVSQLGPLVLLGGHGAFLREPRAKAFTK